MVDYYYVGYYINRYAGWLRIQSFREPIELVRWLKANAQSIDGAIDFISCKEKPWPSGER